MTHVSVILIPNVKGSWYNLSCYCCTVRTACCLTAGSYRIVNDVVWRVHMKKAERGLLFNPMSAVDDPVAAGDSAQTQLDVERQMLRANRVPSLIGG